MAVMSIRVKSFYFAEIHTLGFWAEGMELHFPDVSKHTFISYIISTYRFCKSNKLLTNGDVMRDIFSGLGAVW